MSDLSELPPITNIRRYRYRPGDRIVVRINERLDMEMVNHVQKVIAERLALPRCEDVIVLDSGSDIKVLRNTTEGL